MAGFLGQVGVGLDGVAVVRVLGEFVAGEDVGSSRPILIAAFHKFVVLGRHTELILAALPQTSHEVEESVLQDEKHNNQCDFPRNQEVPEDAIDVVLEEGEVETEQLHIWGEDASGSMAPDCEQGMGQDHEGDDVEGGFVQTFISCDPHRKLDDGGPLAVVPDEESNCKDRNHQRDQPRVHNHDEQNEHNLRLFLGQRKLVLHNNSVYLLLDGGLILVLIITKFLHFSQSEAVFEAEHDETDDRREEGRNDDHVEVVGRYHGVPVHREVVEDRHLREVHERQEFEVGDALDAEDAGVEDQRNCAGVYEVGNEDAPEDEAMLLGNGVRTQQILSDGCDDQRKDDVGDGGNQRGCDLQAVRHEDLGGDVRAGFAHIVVGVHFLQVGVAVAEESLSSSESGCLRIEQ